jgi:hypothetical protein
MSFLSLMTPFFLLMRKIRNEKGTVFFPFSAFEKGIKVSFFLLYFTLAPLSP